MGEVKQDMKKPKLLYLLIFAWIIFGIVFYILGYWSFTIAQYLSSSAGDSASEAFLAWRPMMFFGTLFIFTAMFVFGSIFFIFAYEAYKGKSWIWSAGIIISTIFLVIFSFMMAALMVTAYVFKDPDFSIPSLIIIMIAFLTDLSVLFLTTRPNIRSFLKSEGSIFEKLKNNQN